MKKERGEEKRERGSGERGRKSEARRGIECRERVIKRESRG